MSERSVLEPMLAAVYGVLNTTGLTGLAANGVHTGNAPAGTKPDYVVVCNPTENGWNTLGRSGGECTFQVQSVGATLLGAIRMASKAKDLLHKATPSVGGYVLTSIRWESNAQFSDDYDGTMYHTVASIYRAMAQQSSS